MIAILLICVPPPDTLLPENVHGGKVLWILSAVKSKDGMNGQYVYFTRTLPRTEVVFSGSV